MKRQSQTHSGLPSDGSPPSAAWLFAQAILGNPIPNPYAAAERRSPKNAESWSGWPPSCRGTRFSCADCKATRPKPAASATSSSGWPRSPIGTSGNWHAAREEADRDKAQRTWERFYEDYRTGLTEQWNPNQPRQPKGTPVGGQWAPKGGGGGGGGAGFLADVIRRNQTVGDLTGVVTPGMVASSRLAAKLQSAAKLSHDIATAAAAGLVTGAKAVVNGSATAIKNAATLGLSSSQLELIGVTKEDASEATTPPLRSPPPADRSWSPWAPAALPPP